MTNLTEVGGEFLVNTQTSGYQTYPTVTRLTNGGFVVTWTDGSWWGDAGSGTLGDGSGSSIKAQILDADGNKVGGEFLVNTQTVGNQLGANITDLSNGGFVVTWTDFGGTSGSSIKAQIFNGNGTKVGDEFIVNTEVANFLDFGQVTNLPFGKFVVTWTNRSGDAVGDSSGASVKAQIFDSGGGRIGSEFLVNTQTGGDQSASKFAVLSNGGLVAIWNDRSGTLGDSSGSSIKAQFFDASGQKVGAEFLVNTETAGDQLDGCIFGLTNGGFVATWTDTSGTLGDTSGTSVKAQIFAADGTKIGGEFLINSQTVGGQYSPIISSFSNSDFLITWIDDSGMVPNGNGCDIKAQLFNSTGTKLGGEFTVNSAVIGDQTNSSLAINSQGKVLFSWYDYSGTLGDTAGTSIKAQLFSAQSAAPGGLTLVGTAVAETLTGAEGDDVINGLGGVDSMDGGAGSDIYLITGSSQHKAAEITDTGVAGTDEVRFAATRPDILKIFAGDTGIERVVIGTGTGSTADSSGTLSLNIDASKAANGLTIIGNAGANKLIGTAYADTIDGGADADRMTGGAGNDTYIVDNVKDAISEKTTGGTDTALASVGYTLALNVENLTLTGTADISGTGNRLNNTILGNDGDNTLFGGSGTDTLTGGAGIDTFVFNTKPNAVTNVDTITDFSGDHLHFSLKLFKALGAVGDLTSDQFWSGAGVSTAHDATDRIIYNTTSGDLYYDLDGTGTNAAAVLVANLSGSPALSYADIQIIA